MTEYSFDNSVKEQALRALWRADLQGCDQLLEPMIHPAIVGAFREGGFSPGPEFPTSVGAGQLWYLIQYGESLFLRTFLSGSNIEDAMAYSARLAELAATHLGSVAYPPAEELGAEERAKAAWMHAEAQCICAEIELGRVLVLAKSRSWLKIIFPLKASWRHYEEAHRIAFSDPLFQTHEARLSASHCGDEDPATLYPDALRERVAFGVGAFQFGASLLPPTFLWIAEALGFKGDRQLALEQLKLAARNKRGLRWIHARLMLAAYAWFFGSDAGEKAAGAEIQRLRGDLVDSPIVEMIAAHVARRFGDLEAAFRGYQGVIAGASQLEQFQVTATYEISTIHWFRGEYRLAADLIENYLTRTTNWAYRCFGAYKRGFCLYQLHGPSPDNLAAIAALYARIPQWVDPKMSHDRYALRKSQQFLTHHKFDNFELLWYFCFKESRTFFFSNIYSSSFSFSSSSFVL